MGNGFRKRGSVPVGGLKRDSAAAQSAATLEAPSSVLTSFGIKSYFIAKPSYHAKKSELVINWDNEPKYKHAGRHTYLDDI